MKLLGVIRLAHQIIVREVGFFLINILIVVVFLALGAGLFYLALKSESTIIVFLLYVPVALMLYMYVAATQVQYYGPRLRGEETLPQQKEAWVKAQKQWLPLVLMALLMAGIGLLMHFIPDVINPVFQKVNFLKRLKIPYLTEVWGTPLRNLISFGPLAALLLYILVYLVFPVLALGFTVNYRREIKIKELSKKLWAFYKAKPCSTILLYLFSLVIIIKLPSRLLDLKGPASIPVVDVLFLVLQEFITLSIFVYGLMMALVSQMVLQELAFKEKEKPL